MILGPILRLTQMWQGWCATGVLRYLTFWEVTDLAHVLARLVCFPTREALQQFSLVAFIALLINSSRHTLSCLALTSLWELLNSNNSLIPAVF